MERAFRAKLVVPNIPDLRCGARYLGLELLNLAINSSAGLFKVGTITITITGPLPVVLKNFLVQCFQGAGSVVGVVGTSTVSLRNQVAEMLETKYVRLFVR